MPPEERVRCEWSGSDPLMIAYHDEEWGKPVHDDRRLFEFLLLEGAQAGLSWITILRKREAYRQAFDDFDPAKIARYDGRRLQRLLADPGIVRNKLKLESAVKNARAFLKVQEEFGSFSDYQWQFVGGAPLQNRPGSKHEVPARTELSDALSKDLKKRGFNFVGSTIIYAYMQAVGLVNDHVVGCFLDTTGRAAAGKKEKIADAKTRSRAASAPKTRAASAPKARAASAPKARAASAPKARAASAPRAKRAS